MKDYLVPELTEDERSRISETRELLGRRTEDVIRELWLRVKELERRLADKEEPAP